MAQYGEMGVGGNPWQMDVASEMALGVGQGFDPNISTNQYSSYQAGSPQYFGYRPDTRMSGYRANEFDPSAEGNRYDYGQRQVGFEPGSLADREMLDQYMDPYMQNVVDVRKREAARQGDIRQTQTGLEAAGQGSLGGYREALLRAENERNLMQQMEDIQTEGSQEAFRNAQQAFEADRAARAQLEQFGQSQFGLNEQARQRAAELMQSGYSIGEAAKQAQEELAQSQFGMNQQNIQAGQNLELAKYQAYEQARQQAAQLGLSAQDQRRMAQEAVANIMMGQQGNMLGAAGLLGDLGMQGQEMTYERLRNMLMAGGMERDMLQRGLDIGYQDFLRQQAYPREQVGLYQNLMYGLPVTPGGYSTTFGQQPSTAQQLGGLGIAGLAMYPSIQQAKGGG